MGSTGACSKKDNMTRGTGEWACTQEGGITLCAVTMWRIRLGPEGKTDAVWWIYGEQEKKCMKWELL